MACSGGHGGRAWRGGGTAEGVFRSDPVGVAVVVTFLAGAAARTGEDVFTALAMQTLLLQHLVHPLDDALQALVHVQPHFLLPKQQASMGQLSRRKTRTLLPRSPTQGHLLIKASQERAGSQFPSKSYWLFNNQACPMVTALFRDMSVGDSEVQTGFQCLRARRASLSFPCFTAGCLQTPHRPHQRPLCWEGMQTAGQ